MGHDRSDHVDGAAGAAARPLRILYHHRTAASDGMRVHIAAIVSALRRDGQIVRVVGPGEDDEGDEGDRQPGAHSRLERLAERLRAALPPALFELLELAYNVPAYVRLARAVRQFRPDVIYERYNLFLFGGLAASRRFRLPLLLEVNAPLADERSAFGKLQLRSIARACEGMVWRGADIVLPVTDVLAEKVRGVGVEADAVQVIPNGADLPATIDADQPDMRARLGLSPDDLVLGFVGFIRAWHGVVWAAKALPKLPPQAKLVVVGDGPGLAQLRACAQALGVGPRIHLVGRAAHGDIAAYTRTFDIALQTAATPYASPLKLFEYMAMSRAVVAPDQANIREVLVNGVNALLFDVDDEASFVSALQTLCADRELRGALGRGARLSIEHTPYTWSHNAWRIVELSRACLNRARRAPASSNRGSAGMPLGWRAGRTAGMPGKPR